MKIHMQAVKWLNCGGTECACYLARAAHTLRTYVRTYTTGGVVPHGKQAADHEEDLEHEIGCLGGKANLALVSFDDPSDSLQVHQLQQPGVPQQPRQP